MTNIGMIRPATMLASLSGGPSEVLAGSIERVTFHSAESGFCVLPIKNAHR